MGTRSTGRGNLTTPPSKGLKSKMLRQYCLCKQTNPKGAMVQCDKCRDWFHPACVGTTLDVVERVPEYTCPECTLVSGDSE
jgi:hypothetical protein